MKFLLKHTDRRLPPLFNYNPKQTQPVYTYSYGACIYNYNDMHDASACI